MTRITMIGLALLGAFALLGSASGLAATQPQTPPLTIFIDPGHGGLDSGAIHRNSSGQVDLREKDVNLKVALKLADLLRARGYRVALSRTDDSGQGGGEDVNGDGRSTSRDNLQAIVDAANASGADLFLSIHHNGGPGAGTEVYYCGDQPFADDSLAFAKLVQDNLVEALATVGYKTLNRGVKDDSSLFQRRRGRSGHLFVLGPARSWGRSQVHPRASQVPGVLAEGLFVTNAAEARLLQREDVLDAMVRGYATAIDDYFAAKQK